MNSCPGSPEYPWRPCFPPPRAAAAHGTDTVAAAVAEILTGPQPVAPAPVGTLGPRLASARRAFGDCRYQSLAARLPGLVAAVSAAAADAAPGQGRAAASMMLSGAYVLVADLAEKAGEDGMSWVAADRALSAARDSGDPATLASASRAVAIAMRRLGHYDAATSMLTRAALSLDAGHGSPSAPELAAYGSLLCTAAYSSAP